MMEYASGIYASLNQECWKRFIRQMFRVLSLRSFLRRRVLIPFKGTRYYVTRYP